MTKVIWLGEDTENAAGPSFNIWNGIRFPKDVAVEVTDPYMLAKLRKLGENRFYRMIEDKQEKSHGESQTQNQSETVEDKAKDQGTGYSPVKKKVRKKKPQAQERSDDPNATA